MKSILFGLCLMSLSQGGNAQVAGLDLQSWDRLLGAAVTDGRVDYSQWRDNAEFSRLVAQIAAADTTGLSQAELLVFYINAYNILAAQGIISGQSPAKLLGRYTYFKRTKYRIAGEDINLYDFEHDRIRPLKEPRIHFAIVCASHSCPKLRSEAYTLDKLDEQLEDATRVFVNDPQKNIFDAAAREARISKIFKWFEEDFEAKGTLQEYLAPYLSDGSVAELLANNGFEISHQKYLWHLNGTL